MAADKMMDIRDQIQESTKSITNNNTILGRTTLQPFRPANSGNRALMASVHAEHLMVPAEGDVPIVGTGYENEYGKYSTSYVESSSDYEVIYKINKYPNNNYHYYLIVKDIYTGVYDYIERVPYNHNTESYGYMWSNKTLDSIKPGVQINKESLIKTSIGFDEYGNKMNGANLITAYLAMGKNMEDSLIVSKSAAENKLATHLVKTTSIPINDNDILLNIYGDENIYKTFPDVGEEITGGLFCGIRRLENDHVLYSLSQSNLRDFMLSDRLIQLDGIVADIDVHCNNPSILSDSLYNQQLLYYHNTKMEFYKQIVDLVGPLNMNGTLSHKLQVLYATSRDALAGKMYFKDKPFSNVYLDIVTIERIPAKEGDKVCDRYGGKGVISVVIPDEEMPYLENGRRIEIIKNQSTCMNRENPGQLHEQSLTFAQMRLIDYFKTGVLTYREQFDMVVKYLSLVDDELAKWYAEIDPDDYEVKILMDSIFEEDAIYLSLPPFTTKVNMDAVADILHEFPWIKQYVVYMPIRDSEGELRFIPARRKMTVGKTYNYRLKQYAEEKFSGTSMSATNLKGLNTRSRESKIHESRYNSTPIMFGPMESGNLAHLGVQNVVMMLMEYSSSPQARRNFKQLLTGDPYDINIRLDTDSKNRNAEIINAIMRSMGLELVFEKIPKKKKMMVGKRMWKDVKLSEYQYKTNIRDYVGHDDELDLHYAIALRDKSGKSMAGNVMVKKVGETDDGNDVIESYIE